LPGYEKTTVSGGAASENLRQTPPRVLMYFNSFCSSLLLIREQSIDTVYRWDLVSRDECLY